MRTYTFTEALQSLGYIPPEQASETMIIQNDNDGAGAARIVSDRKAPNEVLQEVKNLRVNYVPAIAPWSLTKTTLGSARSPRAYTQCRD